MELFREPTASLSDSQLKGRPERQELRCFCARQPLLACYGNDKGNLYVHVLVYKQNRIYAEVLVTDGVVQLRCRECLRWHKVKIVQPNRAALEESTAPEVLPPG